jgi:Skp family chaperone for outer membrane proteins
MKSINFAKNRLKPNVLFLMFMLFFNAFTTDAQRSNIRIGYIDTEYILENVPEYQQATAQLDEKVERWKLEIEARLSSLAEKRKQLNNERVLLTKELIEERQEELQIEESEILDYQQKRFGPSGDMMIQKKQLMQPIQDQIFNAIQEIATARNYDFIFDKSSDDAVMLYSADRYDVSDQILRTITRSSKRRQAENRAERKEAKSEELVPEINREQEERAQALEDKKAARAKAIEDRRNKQLEAREAKRAEIEAKKQKIIDERNKAIEEKLKARNQGKENIDSEEMKEATGAANEKSNTAILDTTAVKKVGEEKPKTAAEIARERAAKKVADREARKKALEEKKKKILEARAKARQEKLDARKKNDTTSTKKENNEE